MGVLACDRNGCENIMCDIYVSGSFYVCRECKNEFQEYLEKENISVSTEGEIKRELTKFMATEKGYYNIGENMGVEDFFKKYTK